MKLEKNKILIGGFISALLLLLSACSTVKGVGKDVESLGEEIQDASN